jgi:ribonuclease HI
VTRADVFTDGSCVSVVHRAASTARGYGGWCAVVEHGHEGWVERGSEPNTTAVRMELAAVLGGLRSLPPEAPARLWFDCTVVLSIKDRMDQPLPRDWRNLRDGDLWTQVAAEFVVRDVELRLVVKRERIPQHQRAHTFAGAEAKRLREATRRAERLPEWARHKTG